MNRNGKILVTLVGGLLALCLCLGAGAYVLLRTTGWAVTQVVDSDPATVSQVSDAIVDYTLPAGFDDGYALDIADYSLVSYTAVDGRTHLYLFQVGHMPTPDRDEIEQQLRQVSGGQAWSEVAVVETRPCHIRGEATELIISEGISHDGTAYRSASAFFSGNEGPALVNISGPAASWDQEMVDSFIESLQ